MICKYGPNIRQWNLVIETESLYTLKGRLESWNRDLLTVNGECVECIAQPLSTAEHQLNKDCCSKAEFYGYEWKAWNMKSMVSRINISIEYNTKFLYL